MFGNCMRIVLMGKALANPKGAICIDSNPGVFQVSGRNRKNLAFF